MNTQNKYNMKEKNQGAPINQDEIYHYLKDIRKIKVMTPDREKQLALKMKSDEISDRERRKIEIFPDEFNDKKEIIGSQGLTLNGNAYLDYEINSKNIIQLNLGIPFIVRDIRPDGLTRSFIANIEYRIKF